MRRDRHQRPRPLAPRADRRRAPSLGTLRMSEAKPEPLHSAPQPPADQAPLLRYSDYLPRIEARGHRSRATPRPDEAPALHSRAANPSNQALLLRFSSSPPAHEAPSLPLARDPPLDLLATHAIVAHPTFFSPSPATTRAPPRCVPRAPETPRSPPAPEPPQASPQVAARVAGPCGSTRAIESPERSEERDFTASNGAVQRASRRSATRAAV